LKPKKLYRETDMRTGVIDISDTKIVMKKLGENGCIDGIVNNGGGELRR
jgi:hypothetical protein